MIRIDTTSFSASLHSDNNVMASYGGSVHLFTDGTLTVTARDGGESEGNLDALFCRFSDVSTG